MKTIFIAFLLTVTLVNAFATEQGKFTTTCKADVNDKIQTVEIEVIADVNASHEELNEKIAEFLKARNLYEAVYWCTPRIYGPEPLE